MLLSWLFTLYFLGVRYSPGCCLWISSECFSSNCLPPLKLRIPLIADDSELTICKSTSYYATLDKWYNILELLFFTLVNEEIQQLLAVLPTINRHLFHDILEALQINIFPLNLFCLTSILVNDSFNLPKHYKLIIIFSPRFCFIPSLSNCSSSLISQLKFLKQHPFSQFPLLGINSSEAINTWAAEL